jgi:hypothetical protein
MTKVEKHANYVLDHADMAVMAYHEQDSDNLTVCKNCDYFEYIGLVAHLIWSAQESGAPLAQVEEDLNKAIKLMKEVNGGENE